MNGFGHLTGMGQPMSRGVSFQQNVATVDLTQLKQGDVFKGEITAVSGEEVQLYLGNGQYMQARLEHDVQLALGQILNFQVQSYTGDKLVLKPLYQNAYQNRVGEAALKAAGLPVNEKNMHLIAKMIENGLPIHKESVGKLYRQMLSTPKASLDQLMQMNKLQLKVTPESLLQFQKYEGLQHSLKAAIQDMTKEVFQVYEALQQKGNAEQPLQSSEITAMKNMTQVSTNQTQILSQNQGVGTQQQMDSVMFVDKMLQIISDSVTNQDGGTVAANAFELQLSFDGNLSEVMPQQIADSLVQALKGNDASLPSIENFLQVKLPQMGFDAGFVRDVKEKVYESETFRTHLQGELENQWSLTADEIKEDKTLQFYKRLYEQSHEIARLIDEAGQETAVQTKSAQNVKQNIEFMNQLNQAFQYVQLPLKMSENSVHGELYVFTNKRNLAKRDGTVTALLHLDMDHLGKMDIHVAMQLDTSQVTTRFAVQENMLAFVEAHMEELNSRLKDKGYNCYSSCDSNIEEKSVVEYVEEHLSTATVPLMYQTFDIRA